MPAFTIASFISAKIVSPWSIVLSNLVSSCERTFKINRDRIIQDDRINKNELVALRKQESKSVKKIIHTGWGNAILKYFDVKESKKYSKEQCRIIQSLVEEVEASRRPVDERE